MKKTEKEAEKEKADTYKQVTTKTSKGEEEKTKTKLDTQKESLKHTVAPCSGKLFLVTF